MDFKKSINSALFENDFLHALYTTSMGNLIYTTVLMGNTWTVNIANDILIFHNVIVMLLLIIGIFYCLGIPYVCTMYLIHLISSNSLSISLPLLPPSFIHFLSFFFRPLGSLNAFSVGTWDHLLEHGQSFGAHIPKENRISLSQWSSVANTLSVGDKTFGTPPHSMLGFFVWLDLA